MGEAEKPNSGWLSSIICGGGNRPFWQKPVRPPGSTRRMGSSRCPHYQPISRYHYQLFLLLFQIDLSIHDRPPANAGFSDRIDAVEHRTDEECDLGGAGHGFAGEEFGRFCGNIRYFEGFPAFITQIARSNRVFKPCDHDAAPGGDGTRPTGRFIFKRPG